MASTRTKRRMLGMRRRRKGRRKRRLSRTMVRSL
jgi:hypothetical protein